MKQSAANTSEQQVIDLLDAGYLITDCCGMWVHENNLRHLVDHHNRVVFIGCTDCMPLVSDDTHTDE